MRLEEKQNGKLGRFEASNHFGEDAQEGFEGVSEPRLWDVQTCVDTYQLEAESV